MGLHDLDGLVLVSSLPPMLPPSSLRSKQSNDVRLSRLRTLKARDDAMQDVLKDAAAMLPGLVKSANYPKLLESLITEVC